MTLRFEPQHKFHPHLRRSRRHPDRLCAQALVRHGRRKDLIAVLIPLFYISPN